jgi:hypothetical protein
MSHLYFDGWEIYPKSLDLSSLDVDDCRIDNLISQFAKGLFVDKDVSTLKYMALGISSKGSFLLRRLLIITECFSRWLASGRIGQPEHD